MLIHPAPSRMGNRSYSQPHGQQVVLEGHGLLNGVDFQVRAGEILGIAGLAGAGQSDLLKAIMGALPATVGTLSLEGQPMTPAHPADGWEKGFAFVPQERREQGLVLSRSVRENISLPHLRRLSTSAPSEAVEYQRGAAGRGTRNGTGGRSEQTSTPESDKQPAVDAPIERRQPAKGGLRQGNGGATAPPAAG